MTPRIRSRITLLTLALASLCAAQSRPLFDDDECKAVMDFWATPGRYAADAPADATKKGVWQVRLTPAGSIWLWGLTKGKKIPPTQIATQQPQWEFWIAAKVRHDRWEALKTARAANLETLGQEMPAPDSNTPLDEPPLPGPMPSDLKDAHGAAPSFAEAVAPLEHKIAFDDLNLTYQDNVRMGPRYAYYRFPSGVQSMGAAVKTMSRDSLNGLFHLAGIDDGCARVMRSVSILEGGFDSVNTYDTGFVSVGFIQFASLKDGAGSLGSVLKIFKAADPGKFASDFHRFGVDVDETGHLVVVDPTSGAVAVGADANERIIEDKRLIAVFGRAGKLSDGFCAAQVKAAKSIYWPSEDRIVVILGGQTTPVRVGDLITSEAGLATLFDRKVNTGKIDALAEAVTRVAAAQGLSTVAEVAKYEKPIVAMIRYRKDYLADPDLSQPAEPPVPVKFARIRPGSIAASRSGKTAPGAARGHRRKVKKTSPLLATQAA